MTGPSSSHRYFHADCWENLSAHSVIEPDAAGLSRFGQMYAQALATTSREMLTQAQRRERDLEVIRQQYFPSLPCRLTSFFAATSCDGAERHACRMNDAASKKIPIFEVFGVPAVELDVMWLDIVGLPDAHMQDRYFRYWRGERSSDRFQGAPGPRPPLLEVLLPLPVQIGQLARTLSR